MKHVLKPHKTGCLIGQEQFQGLGFKAVRGLGAKSG